MTSQKLKKIDDQIQELRRAGVSLYQFGTRQQRAGLILMGIAAGVIGVVIGKLL